MDAYDQVRYTNTPHAQTHPSRLFVLGRLAGLDPPPVENCRVLELGASEGVNLAGMAVVLRGANFTGIDLAGEPVARGERTISDLGLRNVRLLKMDVLEVGESFGQFDYIIAHGLYAWAPSPVREKILAIARNNLSPRGLAFVSYNTQPGGRLRQILHEMMMYRVGPAEDPQERLEKAREFLRVIASGRPSPDPLDVAVGERAEELLGLPDTLLLHDDLAENYEPVYFHDFAARAARHGLQYLGEARPLDTAPGNLRPEAIASVREMAAGDRIAEEQYLDFLRMRRFRQSLLCHAEAKIHHAWDVERAEGLYAASSARDNGDGSFSSPAGTRLTTSHPGRIEYLRRLIAAWPGSERVSSRDATLAAELFGAGVADLHAFPGVALRAGEKPCASPLARHQSASGEATVTTLWHRWINLEGEQSRRMLALLDGTRDRDSLAAAMDCSRETLEGQLDAIGRFALFTS